MSINYVDIYAWYNDYQQKAWETANEKKQELGNIRSSLSAGQNLSYYLTLCERGKTIATELNEPYWYLWFENERVSARTQFSKDLEQTLKDATALVVEANKPNYKGCPILVLPHLTLIETYMYFDKFGYTQQILDSIAYCINELPLNETVYLKLRRYQILMYIILEDWEKSRLLAETYHDEVQFQDSESVRALLYLCHITYKMRDYDAMKTYVESAGEIIRPDHPRTLRVQQLYWYGTYRSCIGFEHRKEAEIYWRPIEKVLKNSDDVYHLETAMAQFYYIAEEGYSNDTKIITDRLSSPFIGRGDRALMALYMYHNYKNAVFLGRIFNAIFYSPPQPTWMTYVRKFAALVYLPVRFAHTMMNRTSDNSLLYLWWFMTPPIPDFLVHHPAYLAWSAANVICSSSTQHASVHPYNLKRLALLTCFRRTLKSH